MKRWLIRIPLLLLALALLGAIAIEAVRRSDYPRQLVIEQLQQQTGLIWSAGELRAGWGGQSVLKNVAARLPLDDHPLLIADELRVKHTPLLGLTFGVTIASITIPTVTVDVVQMKDGSLNMQRALESIAAASMRENAGGGALRLPHIDIANATVRLTSRRGETKVIRDASLHGEALDRLSWSATAFFPGAGDANARLAPGGMWRHRIDFNVHDFSPAAHFMSHDQLAGYMPDSAAGQWNGRFANRSSGAFLQGRLHLASAVFPRGRASGSAQLTIAPEHIEASDLAFELQSLEFPDQPARIAGGTAILARDDLRIEAMQISAADVDALLRGEWHLPTASGRVSASWRAEHRDLNFTHDGRADFSLELPAIGDMRLQADIRTSGRAPLGQLEGAWESQFTVDVAGRSLDSFQGSLHAQRLALQGRGRLMTLDGAAVQIERNGSRVGMSDFSMPNARTSINGEVDLDHLDWSVTLMLSQWNAPAIERAPSPGPVDVHVEAHGDPERVVVSRFDATAAHASIHASGEYHSNTQKPLNARVTISAEPDARWSIAPVSAPATQPSPIVAPNVARFPWMIAARSTPASPPLPSSGATSRGTIAANLHVTGALQPLQLEMTGELKGRDLFIDRRRLGSVDATLTAQANQHNISGVLTSGDALIDTLRIDAEYDVPSRQLRAEIDAGGMDVGKAAMMFNEKPVKWAAGRAGLNGTFGMSAIDLDTALFEGQWSMEETALLDQPVGALQGNVTMRNRVIEMTANALTQDDDSHLRVRATYAIQPQTFHASLQAAQWTIHRHATNDGTTVALRFDADAKVQGNLLENRFTGEANLKGDLLLNDAPLGPVQLVAALENRTLHVSRLHAGILDGEISGTASIPLGQWNSAHGDVQWSGIALERVAELVTAAGIVALDVEALGTLDGQAKITTAAGPRAPEPLQATIALQPHNASIGGVALEESSIVVYAGSQRILVEAPQLNIAGGAVNAWTRLSWSHDGLFAHVQAAFNDLSLDQLVHVVDRQSGPVPGLLTGRLAGGGYIATPHRAFGQAEIAIRESDLANIPLISVLYRTLNLRIGESKPEGEGKLLARLDGNSLDLTRLTYFNRGIDVVTRVRVEDIFAGQNSPIDGVAVGVLRPLKKIDLPLIRDLDTAMKVLQTGASSVRMGGTVGAYEIKVVPFSDIASSLNSALSGL